MANNKNINADLDRVGKVLTEVSKANKKLSDSQLKEIKSVLKEAALSLLKSKASLAGESKVISDKKAAVGKSANEKLISEADVKTENKKIAGMSVMNRVKAKRVNEALDSIKILTAEVSKLSAEPRLEQLDKGHESDTSIKEPPKAQVSAKEIDTAKKSEACKREDKKRLACKEAMRRHIKEAIAKRNKKSIKAEVGKVEKTAVQEPAKVNGPGGHIPDGTGPHGAGMGPGKGMGDGSGLKNLKEDIVKKEATKPVLSEKKLKAKQMYVRASELIKEADKETDSNKKASLSKRAYMLEKMADAIVSTEINKTASKQKTYNKGVEKKASTEEKEASTVTFAANDSVLLPDGAVGKVSAINENKLTVSVAGVDKEVLAETVKKITSMTKTTEETKAAKTEKATKDVKATSLKDKIKSAINMVRSNKKKQADVDDVLPAVAPGAPESTIEEVAETAGDTVSTSEAKNINFNGDLGKYVVTVSEAEVLAFDDEASAQAFVSEASKKKAAADKIIDSADTATPEGSETNQKKLKGLDQKDKDYGTTTSEEKVNPQFSMVGSKKQAAADKIINSGDTAVPEGSETIQTKLRGLDQKGKDYGTTTADEKINPQLSVFAKKEKILVEANKRQAARLKILEAKQLVDRAVKVGAITEEQRSEQETVLAELYESSHSDFNAYGRLIANLEANQESSPSIASRTVKKVTSALANKRSILTDGFDGITTASLESGNFFEEEDQ